ncbi:hypothetical protein HYDPIDRAFT_153403 [Hydnomerulius pinastri MD-312]|uniref:F-box domain-containing protein n=1 Tax=Hydnomerulius pinastri MD-312 TaxID=994086 RepID=A0A0C9W1E9_9AGAM|nr:hypothetical protein HYDPIDRAFT_153403 [Hydnomerulius pinastri MD-312]
MAQFNLVLSDLPLELLPAIFDFVVKPQHISALCLVNKTFNHFATPLLYRRVFIFAWYKEAKSKVALLFRTLSESPQLARHVQRLEIRDFPKALSASGHLDLLQLCIKGIKNCVNLRSCTWTRDGSLHSAVLESLRDCPQLRELEINGNSSGYNPIMLTQFTHLSKLSLIMPSAQVLDIFPSWISMTGATLRSLTIICKASTLVTDVFLAHLAPNLEELEYLYIIGCPKVTHGGIGAVASANKNGLLGISLEGLSQAFDMSEFKAICLRKKAFRRLRAITLTVHVHIPLDRWTHDVEELLSPAPLEVFSIYSTTTSIRTPISDDFWKSIITKHGPRLKRFSIHRMQISLAALQIICSQCPLLEQLFVVAEQRELDVAGRLFALARNLRTLHINFPLATSESAVFPSVLMQSALSIVYICSPTLTHIGCNTRVWQIKRVVHEDESGEKYTVPTLAPQENPDIPEQFLVIHA